METRRNNDKLERKKPNQKRKHPNVATTKQPKIVGIKEAKLFNSEIQHYIHSGGVPGIAIGLEDVDILQKSVDKTTVAQHTKLDYRINQVTSGNDGKRRRGLFKDARIANAKDRVLPVILLGELGPSGFGYCMVGPRILRNLHKDDLLKVEEMAVFGM